MQDRASVGRAKLFFLGLVMAASCKGGCSSCAGMAGTTHIANKVDSATNAVGDAIRSLSTDSDKWRGTLEGLMKKLDPQATLRNEVANLLQDSIGVANAGVLCTSDFIAKRAVQRLRALQRGVPSQTDLDPDVCEVVPPLVEYEHWQKGNSPKIDLYGSDLEDRSLSVWLFEGKEKREVPAGLAHATRFQLTIDLGKKGVNLGPDSTRIKLIRGKDFARAIAEVVVSQPHMPPCETRTIPFHPNALTVVGKKCSIASADDDFNGHGPQVTLDYELSVDKGRRVQGVLDFFAMEAEKDGSSKHDFTCTEGANESTLYAAPDGWKIDKVNGVLKSHRSYYDSDPELQDSIHSAEGPIATWQVGPTAGIEGVRNVRVVVDFAKLEVTEHQDQDCKPSGSKKTPDPAPTPSGQKAPDDGKKHPPEPQPGGH
jgi:hypothetical protein